MGVYRLQVGMDCGEVCLAAARGRALGGPALWIKRDDTLGLAAGGNKTRKLEFLVADGQPVEFVEPLILLE